MNAITMVLAVSILLANALFLNAQEPVPSVTVELDIVCDMDFSHNFENDEEKITDFWIHQVRDLEMMFQTLRKTIVKFALKTVMVIKTPVEQPFIEQIRSRNNTPMVGLQIRNEFSKWVYKKGKYFKGDIVILATGFNHPSAVTLMRKTVCQKGILTSENVLVLRYVPSRWLEPYELAESVANLIRGEDNANNDCRGSGLISDSQVTPERRWYFSNCSDYSIHQFLTEEKPLCLKKVEQSIDLTRVATRASHVLSLSEQCKVYHNDSDLQPAPIEGNFCVRTICAKWVSNSRVGNFIFPIYNTPCGDENSFCFRGRCLQRGVIVRNICTNMCVLSTDLFADNDYVKITDCPEVPTKFHEFMIEEMQNYGLKLSIVYTNRNYKDKCLTVEDNKLKFSTCSEYELENFGWDFVDTGDKTGNFFLCHRSSKTCAISSEIEQSIILVNATLVLDNPLSLWRYHLDDEASLELSKQIRKRMGRLNYCQHYYNEPVLTCCSRNSTFQKCKPPVVTTTTTTELPKTTTQQTTPMPTTNSTEEPTTMRTTTTATTTEPSTSEPSTTEIITTQASITTTEPITEEPPVIQTSTSSSSTHLTLETTSPEQTTVNPINPIQQNINTSTEGQNDSLWLIYLTLSLVVVLIVLIGTSFFVKFLRKSKRVAYNSDVISLDKFYKGDTNRINANEGVASQADLLPFDKHWEFPVNRLKLGQKLGSGAFGLVVEAKAVGILENEEETTVAVKMVNTCADVTHLKALMTELKIMSHLGGHLNIVNLLGACTENIAKSRQLYVIIEFCKYGCLRSYLHKHRRHFVDDTDTSFYANNPKPDRKNLNDVRNVVELSRTETATIRRANQVPALQFRRRPQVTPENEYTEPPVDAGVETITDNEFKTITTMDLMCWSFQVARGMEYLASKRVLHGDLAARNCLLAENNAVKICDFGFSKTLNKNYQYNYKKNCEGVLLPFKWMAIESMTCGIFSSESDCWSYGVVLWEIFTLGETPYPGFSVDNNFIEYVSSGNRMSKPPHAPQRMYDLMLECWSKEPEERPKFSTIVDTIGGMLEKDICEHYVKMNSDYQNISKFSQKSDFLLKMGQSERHKGCETRNQNLDGSSKDTSKSYQVGKKVPPMKPKRMSTKPDEMETSDQTKIANEYSPEVKGCARFSKQDVELHP